MQYNFFILVLFGVVVANTNIHAQRVSKGYILTLENDTVPGVIIDRTDAELAFKVEFKQDLADTKVISYTPTQLLGFGFDYGRNFNQISINKGTKEPITIFAKSILEGKIDMHIWRKLKRNDFDIILLNNFTHDRVHLVKPEKTVVNDDRGIKYSKTGKQYLQLLKNVKRDSLFDLSRKKNIRYSEKAVSKDILSYNQSHKDNFPLKKYQEKKEYNYNITGGIQLRKVASTDFRIAFYRNRIYPEKSRKLSYTWGISYRFIKENELDDSDDREYWLGNLISVIPVGVNFHSDKGTFRPYGYFGLGLVFLFDTSHYDSNLSDKENKTEILPLITANIGAGVKIKMGSKFLLMEFTPSLPDLGVFLNVGVSF